MPALARTDLRASLARARSAIVNIREAARVGIRRATVPVVSAPTAYSVGRLHGWAMREGKDLNIPNTEVSWTLVGGIVLAAAGSLGEKLLGDSLADVTLGMGTGAVDANLAMLGREHGFATPEP